MDKIKVLLFAANPFGDLNLDEEIRRIEKKLEAHRHNVELVSVRAVRPGELIDELKQHKPVVVQFSGHGSRGGPSAAPAAMPSGQMRDFIGAGEGGQIILTGDGGKPQPVSQEALVDLFRVRKDNIRLVVLNACFTRPQAEAIARVVDCVIGTDRAIGDDAARVFAARFYRSLADGHSIHEAFEEARVEMKLEGFEKEADIPRLVPRKGVDLSNFRLAQTSTAEPVPRPKPQPQESKPAVERPVAPVTHAPASKSAGTWAALGIVAVLACAGLFLWSQYPHLFRPGDLATSGDKKTALRIEENQLVLRDLVSGQVKWEVGPIAGKDFRLVKAAAIAPSGDSVFLVWPGLCVLLDGKTGKQLWEKVPPNFPEEIRDARAAYASDETQIECLLTILVPAQGPVEVDGKMLGAPREIKVPAEHRIFLSIDGQLLDPAEQKDIDIPGAQTIPSAPPIAPQPNPVPVTPHDAPGAGELPASASVVWKVPLTRGFHERPVLSENKLFIQSSDEDGHKVALHCFDSITGQSLWSRSWPFNLGQEHSPFDRSPAPAVDGQRVYWVFWHGFVTTLEAYDYEGNSRWQIGITGSNYPPDNRMSPLVVGDWVYVVSFNDALLAFDAMKDDIPIWRVELDRNNRLRNPPIVRTSPKGNKELVTCDQNKMTGYDSETGRVVWNWEWNCPDGPCEASCAFLNDCVFAHFGAPQGNNSRIVAIRIDDAGRPTLLWEQTKGNCSVEHGLLVADGRLFTMPDRMGIAACYDSATGKELWTYRFTGDFRLPPVLASGNIYLAANDGTIYVYPATTSFHQKARYQLNEPLITAPVAANGHLYIRGEKHLFCIDAKE
jgi:outer membrane protein assembly factor BamB